MLHPQAKKHLAKGKNLLAFSAGSDSTALFFLLREAKINFDIAIVDYALRKQSKEEVAYAKTLASRYGLACYVYNAPKIKQNFESQARNLRYQFFERLIKEQNYTNLLTAHHLGDRFEWMLMQFCKGAGCMELTGMQVVQTRSHYTLLRPLLDVDKSELLSYLQKHKHHYFEDESNQDPRYMRNKFRMQHATPLLKEYLAGIKKSFHYLERDMQELYQEPERKQINQLAIFYATPSTRSNIYAVDKYLKTLGHSMSAAEKELLYQQKTTVIGRKYLVAFYKNEYLFVAPYVKQKQAFSKQFKEKMRLLSIEPKLRSYLACDEEALDFVSFLLQ